MTARRHRPATVLERLWAWLCDSPDPRRVDYATVVDEDENPNLIGLHDGDACLWLTARAELIDTHRGPDWDDYRDALKERL